MKGSAKLTPYRKLNSGVSRAHKVNSVYRGLIRSLLSLQSFMLYHIICKRLFDKTFEYSLFVLLYLKFLT